MDIGRLFRLLLLLLHILIFIDHSKSQMPGFVSLDCGGMEDFTDKLGLNWSRDALKYGDVATISVANETRKQFTTLRHFPADTKKYCYTLNVTSRARYLTRVSFLYGNFDNNNVYPKFDISLGPTHWSTVVISDANTVQSLELIFLATGPSISVCLSNARTGQPFISTIELRQFDDSMYFTDFESKFYMTVSARVNFGAESEGPVRYPDDPYDRIWESDAVKLPNYLVDVAAGTVKVSTQKPIDANNSEKPPQKVMQTAVVGGLGELTYRINLADFPGPGWAFGYFAEIEDYGPEYSRKFNLEIPGMSDISDPFVNIQENAHGKYRLYEPGFDNISLPFVLNFKVSKTLDSSLGPLLNAMEINKYLKKTDGSPDGDAVAGLMSMYLSANWPYEGGDPCLPVPWSWVHCSSGPQPRIVAIFLSNKNLTGNSPPGLTKLTDLVELWLDGNSLTGPIPDFSGCNNLKIIHLENNRLTGNVPSSLRGLQSLTELYIQNNLLSGILPSSLLGRNIELNYAGNINLRIENKLGNFRVIVIVGVSVGAAVLVVVMISLLLYLCTHCCGQKRDSKKDQYKLESVATEDAYRFTYCELQYATRDFRRKIGAGSYGEVFCGKTKYGKEIAVKVLADDSYEGMRDFSHEVALISRIHHINLVQFIGYCQENGKRFIVYELMHNGTLKDHLSGQIGSPGRINWLKRLEIAEDAAKGIVYLHTGCNPPIIHRDLKSSNILLDKDMRAKVSDFGLSKLEGLQQASPDVTKFGTTVCGTLGYMDPEYLVSHNFTFKSDVYSFGVILLELISGREVISEEKYGVHRNIINWARLHIQNGDIHTIIDPSLENEFDMQSMWKIAEKAYICVNLNGSMRPTITDVIKEIQEAICIERAVRKSTSDPTTSPENMLLVDDSIAQPTAR